MSIVPYSTLKYRVTRRLALEGQRAVFVEPGDRHWTERGPLYILNRRNRLLFYGLHPEFLAREIGALRSNERAGLPKE